MSDRKIRIGCCARGLNRRKDRTCSEEEPCVSCVMEQDVQENKAMYEAMAKAGEDYDED